MKKSHPPKEKIIYFILIGLLIIGVVYAKYTKSTLPSSVVPTTITDTPHQDTGPIYDPGEVNNTTVTSLTAADIDAMAFPPLQQEMLAGYDAGYTLPSLKRYDGSSFMLQYPSDLEITSNTDTNVGFAKWASCKRVDGTMTNCHGTISIGILYTSQQISLSEWFIQSELGFFKNGKEINVDLIKQSMKTTSVGGVKALYNDLVGQSGHVSNGVIFVHDTDAYVITLQSYGVPGMVASFREIVNSFRFK